MRYTAQGPKPIKMRREDYDQGYGLMFGAADLDARHSRFDGQPEELNGPDGRQRFSVGGTSRTTERLTSGSVSASG